MRNSALAALLGRQNSNSLVHQQAVQPSASREEALTAQAPRISIDAPMASTNLQTSAVMPMPNKNSQLAVTNNLGCIAEVESRCEKSSQQNRDKQVQLSMLDPYSQEGSRLDELWGKLRTHVAELGKSHK